MKKKLRLEVFGFLDKLKSARPAMGSTDTAKHVQREFCLTWDDSKKAVATWDRQRAK